MKASKLKTHIEFLKYFKRGINKKSIAAITLGYVLSRRYDWNDCPEWIFNEYQKLIDESVTFFDQNNNNNDRF